MFGMTSESATYNYIYSRLVTAPDDIIGIIAYARYKQQKIEWITAFKEKHEGSDPGDVDLEPFHSLTNTETALTGYRRQAKEILDEYLSKSIEQASLEISESYNEILLGELKNVEARYADATRPLMGQFLSFAKSELKEMKPGFWSGVTQNVLANIVILIITALILLVLWSLKASPAQVLGDVFGYDVKEKKEVSATTSGK